MNSMSENVNADQCLDIVNKHNNGSNYRTIKMEPINIKPGTYIQKVMIRTVNFKLMKM